LLSEKVHSIRNWRPVVTAIVVVSMALLDISLEMRTLPPSLFVIATRFMIYAIYEEGCKIL
jgi:hypothetical protein